MYKNIIASWYRKDTHRTYKVLNNSACSNRQIRRLCSSWRYYYYKS